MSIHHKKGERPYVIACSVFGGRSPRTGKLVGTRHSWDANRCRFCHKYRNDVMTTPERT